MNGWSGRREDARLVTGAGGFVADRLEADMRRAGFLRAPVASGRLVALDVDAALAIPGVIAVLTAKDLAADGIGPIAHDPLPRDDGGAQGMYPQPILASDVIGFAGEPLALVVADTAGALEDALEALAPEIAEASAPEGVAFLRRLGGAQETEAALAAAAHRATVRLDWPRVAAFALEPRGALARPEPGGGMLYRASTQNPFALRAQIAAHLGWDETGLRVVAEDVGGSFGLKGFMAPEDAALCWASRRLNLPLAWLPSRGETQLGDAQGRAATAEVSIGLDADLDIAAVRASFRVDAGAYPSRRSMGIVNNATGITGVYRVPCAAVEVAGHLSARPPIAPFRGNGRPEATHAIESALDAVARVAGVDPVELRRRNLIGASEMPVTTALGAAIDCGDFARVLDAARDLNGDPAPRRRAAEARGMLYGVGLANCIESAGGPVRKPKPDCARIEVRADGTVTVAPGVMSVGQGHETALAAMAATRLEIAPERIRYRNGDTEALSFGRGSGGSSGLSVAGAALHAALDQLLMEGAERAGRALGCARAELDYRDGAFHRAGTNAACALAELADAAGAWRVEATFTPEAATWPNGSHICEVEVDPETGAVRVTRYAAAEDVGRVLNPVLVEGQLHGGIAQGLSLGLGERMVYDDHGQLLTGSLMDYALPRAADLPVIRLVSVEVPTALNPLGVKGVGEAGAVGATAALAAAMRDALGAAGVADFTLPATPERVWSALEAAQRDADDGG